MGKSYSQAGRSELKGLCEYILGENDNAIHLDDFLHVLKRRSYRIKPKKFRAMLPVLSLKIDPEDGCTVQKRKKAYHGVKSKDIDPKTTQALLDGETS